MQETLGLMSDAPEKESLAPGEIDRDRAGRKVWVVRVPPYVAKQWREAIAASAGGLVDEHSAEAATLGHLTLDEGNPTTLRVKGPDGEEQLLYMNSNRDEVATNILSYEPTADGSITAPRLDGVVYKRFDAAPVNLGDAARTAAGQQRQQQAAGQVDDSYLAKTRARLAAAGKPAQKRKVEVLEDDHEINRLAGGSEALPLYVKNRQAKKAQVGTTTTKRRDKMTKEELEAQLFVLFGQQQHWHFTQIQKTLNQPVAAVKEMLFQMADQIKRGPNKDLWELKPAMKAALAAQAKQAAAAAAAGGGS